MNQLERIILILLCVTCFGLIFVLPTAVYGEENIGESTDSSNIKEDWKTRSVLFSNLEKVDNELKDTAKSTHIVVQEAVDFTKQTVIDLFKPIDSKSVNTRLEVTGDLLIKTGENSEPALEKSIELVTYTVVNTTSDVTNAVNDTVNSVVNELPIVPIVTPVVNEVSKTVRITTSSVHAVVEKTGEIVNENEKSTNDISRYVVVENSDIADSEDKKIKPSHEIIQNDERTVISEGNFDQNPTNYSCEVCLAAKQEPVIPSLPDLGTDGLFKQDGTSDLEEHDDIEIVKNDGVNLVVDSISRENSIELPSIVKKSLVVELVNRAIEQVVNSQPEMINKNRAYTPNYPLEPSQKGGSLPSAIITVASPSTTSLSLLTGGQSDLFSGVIVDVFTFISSNARQLILTDEKVTGQWTHAPPGKPPKQFSNFKM